MGILNSSGLLFLYHQSWEGVTTSSSISLSARSCLGFPNCCGCCIGERVWRAPGLQREKVVPLQPVFLLGTWKKRTWLASAAGTHTPHPLSVFPSCPQARHPGSGARPREIPPFEATQTLPYPNVLMALRCSAVAENLLKTENKLHTEVWRKWLKDSEANTPHGCDSTFFLSVLCRFHCQWPLCTASPTHLPMSVFCGFAFTGESQLLVISCIWLLLYVHLPYDDQLCSTVNQKEACSITPNHML